jgi:hypothetical protein
VRQINEQETNALESGISVAEAVLPKARPSAAAQLGLWG